MKSILILAILTILSGCTVNYIHGTDVTLYQGEQGMESVDQYHNGILLTFVKVSVVDPPVSPLI